MGKIIIFVILLAIIAVGLTVFKQTSKNPVSNKSVTSTLSPATTPKSSSSQIHIPKTQIIATGLEVPWALAFLPASPAGGPDKSILITERIGRVRLINKDNTLQLDPITTIKEVKQRGESGLHGVAIHPDFLNNHFVYFYYTYSDSGDNTLNRVVRFKFENQSLSEEKIIVDQIPGAIFHDGGRIKFGPDKYLYITTGDALNPSLAQDKNSLAGKILRVTDEGQAAPGNPFNNLVYSLGHRNPQGITWDDKGRLWETEHGQTATDEINLVEIGGNYGWPTIRGDQTNQNMISPILHSGNETWAPAGTTFYNDSIFFAGLRGQAFFEYKIAEKELKEHFKGEFGRIREVVLGGDNMLYITTSNKDGRGFPQSNDDKVIRVDPNQL